MAFSFHYPSKGSATKSWVPDHGPVFPLSFPEDYPGQIVLRAGDGDVHVQDHGNSRKTISLNFNNSPELDVSGYREFFNKVKKSFYSFEYEDRAGALRKVRIMNAFNFRKTGVITYSGSIELELV